MTDNSSPRKPCKAIGIDLGTTFSAIAQIDPYGKPQIIPNAESEGGALRNHPQKAQE
jgi:molecular chaperone DnaK (HSP70)